MKSSETTFSPGQQIPNDFKPSYYRACKRRMENSRVGQDSLPLEIRQEGREAVEDTLDRMNCAVAEMGQGTDLLAAFRKDAHNLKGLGAVFSFSGLALIAHRLEDYMADLESLDAKALADIQNFLDRIAELSESNIDASADEVAGLVQRLPVQKDHRRTRPS